MNYLGRIIETGTKTLLSGESFILNQLRGKKTKAKGSSRNKPIHTRPKHRGWKVQDSTYVSENKILATQRNLRFRNLCSGVSFVAGTDDNNCLVDELDE